MLCCLIDIGMLIFGIVTLITGRFLVMQNRVVYGTPARVIGVILMLSLPLAFGLNLALGLALAAASGGTPPPPADLLPFNTVIGIAVPAICLFVAYAVGVTYQQLPPIQRTQADQEADDIIRRRFLHDLADDDAPRRPRAAGRQPPPLSPDERIQ